MIHATIDMEDLLRRVSRSFYLTLRILPQAIKPQLSLAYLLARATDTVADTDVVDAGRRREVLADFRRSIQDACAGKVPAVPDFSAFIDARHDAAGVGTDAEKALLRHFPELLQALGQCAAADRERIRTVLEIITRGQEADLRRFGASGGALAALASDDELDAYTYAVAGCVGEFWTHLCRAHVFPEAALEDAQLVADAVRFGKGLQLVNILRDLPGDLRQGRCYIPEQALAACGLTPADLLHADAMEEFRPLYARYLQQAEAHLRAGWRYTTSLPFGCIRVRLACAWPVLIGLRTLDRLRQGNVLDSAQRIKLTRAEIWRIVWKSVLGYPLPRVWNRLA